LWALLHRGRRDLNLHACPVLREKLARLIYRETASGRDSATTSYATEIEAGVSAT
jgi:hypothetical protein